jgi:leader peptidase (prepilin peptidase)/N-methyltransferase
VDGLQQAFYLISLFVFGLVFGSFGNVVIWRLPRNESLSSPGSHCPSCGHAVRPYDNVPVLSWLLLRGKCRDCAAGISVRYPVVELLSGCLWVLAGVVYGFSWRAAAAAFLFYLLLLLAAIDLDTMRLPNKLVALMAAAGAAGVVLALLTGVPVAPLTPLAQAGWLSQPLASAAFGCLLGSGLTFGIAAAYSAVRRRQGMGMGDFKLIAAGGLFLGGYVLVALLLGSLLGAVAGVALARGDGPLASRRFPFGPFLAAGIVLAAVFGPALLRWYLGIAGLG